MKLLSDKELADLEKEAKLLRLEKIAKQTCAKKVRFNSEEHARTVQKTMEFIHQKPMYVYQCERRKTKKHWHITSHPINLD